MSSQSDLADLIRSKFVGVEPDSQDTVLEDDDWRLILDALQPSSAADAKPVAHEQLVALTDFIDQPSRSRDVESPELRDYRRDLMRLWEPILTQLLAQPQPSQQAGAEGVSREHLVLILRELITEQSEGEWDDAMINKDADKFATRILATLNPSEAKG